MWWYVLISLIAIDSPSITSRMMELGLARGWLVTFVTRCDLLRYFLMYAMALHWSLGLRIGVWMFHDGWMGVPYYAMPSGSMSDGRTVTCLNHGSCIRIICVSGLLCSRA